MIVISENSSKFLDGMKRLNQITITIIYMYTHTHINTHGYLVCKAVFAMCVGIVIKDGNSIEVTITSVEVTITRVEVTVTSVEVTITSVEVTVTSVEVTVTIA